MKIQVFSSLSEKQKSNYKTEKQWLKQGFIPVSRNTGVVMYPNHYYSKQYVYFSSTDVRKASEKELFPYREAERNKRRERRLKEKEKREREKRQNEFLVLCERQGKLDAEKYKGIVPTLKITIDIETTGLEFWNDEILQVSVMDINTKEVLLSSYVKPYFTEDWPEARRVNYITKEMVQNAPYFHEILPELNKLLAQAKSVVGYNINDFDYPFLVHYGAIFNEKTEIEDLIFVFAAIYGDFCKGNSDFKLKSLSTCAAFFGYDWNSESAHNSLSDCKAVTYWYDKIMEDSYQTLYEENLYKRDNGFFYSE